MKTSTFVQRRPAAVLGPLPPEPMWKSALCLILSQVAAVLWVAVLAIVLEAL